MIHQIKLHRFSLVLLVALNATIFFQVYFLKHSFIVTDALLQRAPSMAYWVDRVKAGQIPLWNPYIFAGIPHLADLSTNTLSPFNLIYLLIPNTYQAMSVLAGLLVLISSIGTYYLALNFSSKKGAFLAAIIFAYSGTTLAGVNDVNSLAGIALLPCVLALATKYTQKPTTTNQTWLIIILFVQFISSHPQYSYYTWVTVSLFLMCHLPFKFFERLKLTLVTLILSLLISSIQLLPFLELTTQTFRPTTSQFSSQNSLQFLDLPRFLVPTFYGTWRSGITWGPAAPLETGRANTEGFLGIIPLILSLHALKTRSRNSRFFFILAVLSLLASFGPALGFYHLLRLLPGFSLFRSPARLLCVYSLSIAILAAIGVDNLTKKT